MAAPVLGSSTLSGRFSSSSSWVVNKPSGVSAGDLLVIIIDTNNAAGNPSTPTGWTLGPAETAGACRVHTFWRIADGSEGSTFTVGFTSPKTGAAVVLQITGTHQTAPVNGTLGEGNTTGGGANPTAVSSITSTVDNCLLLLIADCGFSIGNNSFTGPAGWTKAIDLSTGNQEQIEVFTETLAVAGSTGSMNWNSSQTGVNRGYLGFAIAPPDPGQSRNVGGLSSDEAFSALVIDQTVTVGPAAGIPSAEAFSTFQFNQEIAPGSIFSAEAFGVITGMDQEIRLGAIAAGEAFGVPTINGEFTPASIASAEAFGAAPTFEFLVPIASIASAEAFGVVDLQCMIAPASIASAEAFALPAATMEIGGGGSGAGGVPPLGDIFDEAFGAPILQLPDRGPVPAGVAIGLDNTDPYGIDLELTADGDLALRGRGDLARVGGAANCAQALVLRLRAYPGELPLHLDYGSLLADQLVGLKQLDVQLARSTANAQARQVIEHDRRFLAIKDVTAAFAGPSRVAVGLTLRLAGGELVALDDLAETRVDEVTVDATSQLDTDLDLAGLDAGLIDYDRDDLGDVVDVDLLTGISF